MVIVVSFVQCACNVCCYLRWDSISKGSGITGWTGYGYVFPYLIVLTLKVLNF